MKILCTFGQYAYGDPRRGESYEYTNFLPALRALGHEVVLFDSWDRSAYANFAELNRAFLEIVGREAPDVIFCVLMGYELWQETLTLARQAGPVLVNWATDDSWKYAEFSRFVAPAFDVYATTYPSAMSKAQQNGHDNFILTQWAASGSLLAQPKPARQCRHRVSFIGAAYGNRRRWIEALNKQGVEVDCFGYGWSGGAIPAAAVPEIIRDSIISLNFSDSSRMFPDAGSWNRRQIKARVFEVTGMGGCLLTEPAQGLENYFRIGQEIATFSTPAELVQKIRGLLENPERRDVLAHAGYTRTKNEHTYERRFERLLAFPTGPTQSSRKKSRSIDWAKFEKHVASHQIGPTLHLFARFLRWSCSAVWGAERGPRAARRAVYEISWRLFRGYTYRAIGWPGRLFYRES